VEKNLDVLARGVREGRITSANMLNYISMAALATDSVDPEPVTHPRRWDIQSIRRFMLVFGLANSACDNLTFGVLLRPMHVDTAQFPVRRVPRRARRFLSPLGELNVGL